MRVITGIARGRRLWTLTGRETRPTSESVKEAMMSIIQFEIEGAKVLDLFAGTGQLGIEALSRGAKSATFVDASKRCRGVIKDNLEHTKLGHLATVYESDVDNWLLKADGPFDSVLADPPYQQGIMDKTLPLIVPLMHPAGVIICETEKRDELPQTIGDFEIKKEYKYGKRKLTLYRKIS